MMKTSQKRKTATPFETSESRYDPPRYTAFISYRHAPLDQKAATMIQKFLERYTIPKKLREHPNEKHISHLFRDEDELPTSSSLSDSIRMALEHSEFLIVICSPRTKESKWIAREIDEFIRMHGRDRVLAVLIEGDPDESFPARLLCEPDEKNPGRRIDIEPLAADIRAKAPRKMKKKIRREGLRIMAQFLHVPFDTLAQRDREYFLRKAMTISGTVVGCLSLFTAYTLYQNVQITHLYSLSQKTIARNNARRAMTELSFGDPQSAIRQLSGGDDLHTLSENPDTYRALSSLCGAYASGIIYHYAPVAKSTALSGAVWNVQTAQDSQGQYGTALLKNQAYVSDLNTGEQIWSFKPADLKSEYAKDINCTMSFVCPLNENVLLALINRSLVKIDLSSKQITEEVSLSDDSYSPYSWAIARSETKIWIAGEDFVCRIDPQTMQEDYHQALEIENFRGYTLTEASDASFAAVLKDRDLRSSEEETGSVESLLVIEEEKDPVILDVRHSVEGMKWLSETLYILQARSSWDSDLDAYTSSDQSNSLRRFKNGALSDSVGSFLQLQIPAANRISTLHREEGDLLALPSAQQVIFIDPKTLQTIGIQNFKGTITQVLDLGSEIAYGVTVNKQEFGRVGFDTLSELPAAGYVFYSLDTNVDLESMTYYPQDDRLVGQFTQNNTLCGLITFANRKNDAASIFESDTLYETKTGTLRDGTPLLMLSYGKLLSSPDCMKILSADTFEPLATIDLEPDPEKADDFESNAVLVQNSDEDIILFSDGKSIIETSIFNPDQSECESLPGAEANLAVFSADGHQLFLCSDREGQIFEKENGRWALKAEFEAADFPIASNTGWTSDGDYLTVGGYSKLQIWSRKENAWLSINEKTDIDIPSLSGGSHLDPDRNRLLYYEQSSGDEQSEIRLNLLDLNTRTLVFSWLPEDLQLRTFSQTPSLNGIDLCDHDSKLIVRTLGLTESDAATQDAIRIYDTKTANILGRFQLDADMSAEFFPPKITASPDGTHFTALDPGGFSFSIANGVASSQSYLFSIENGSISVIADCESSLSYLPEQNLLLYNRSNCTSIIRILSFSELLDRAAAAFPDPTL